MVPLERNLYGHPLAGPLWKSEFKEVLSELGWEEVPHWECLFGHRKPGLILSVSVDGIKMAGKKKTMSPVWKTLMKNVDLDLDDQNLECTQRECKPSEIGIKGCREMFESRISAGTTENYQGGKHVTQRRLRCPTMDGCSKMC